MKHWERIAWMVALIGGIHAAYTTWMSGWIYMNGRRDLILGIGQPKPLPLDQARLIFLNDWVTCALGFSIYVLIAFGALWVLLSKYQPMQEAILNPFGLALSQKTAEKRRSLLSRWISLGVSVCFLLLAATFWKDANDTLFLMKKYCP